MTDAKVALVTGGTDGVGQEIARGLALAGYRTVIVGRDMTKGQLAVEDLARQPGRPLVHFLAGDVSSVQDIDRLAAMFTGQFARLDCLVHSAGVVMGRRKLTAEGIERNFATNYLGRFVLTNHLVPMLMASGTVADPARVLLISGAARGRIRYDDLNLARFTTLRAVQHFCRANDVFTLQLARSLPMDGQARVTTACLKLGVVKTRIRRTFPLWMKVLVPLLIDPLLGQTPAEAAAPALALLLDRTTKHETGVLISKIRRVKRIRPDAELLDPASGRRLWDVSMSLAARARVARGPLSPALA